ncbi:MAG: hypothetical protein Q3961_02000 [Bifidobacteriaceae bacterium]|nr:hypothetical protein [Bifidobacteriaceae bacterium]
MSRKDNDFADFNKLVSKANKRLRRLEKKGWKTRAYNKAVKTGGKFHNRRGASYKEKAREYQRVKNFLNSETSTVRGSKKVLKQMLSRTGLEDIVGDDPDTIMTSEEVEGADGSVTLVNKFFDIASMVDDYLENHRGVKISSDEIWRSIHDTYLAGYEEDFSDADAEEIVGDVVRRLHNDYLKTHTSSSSHKTWSAI